MNVIIGAGPAGLYTAIKLTQAGLQNIVVFDLRAGVYTRPGNLDRGVFQLVGEGIGLSFNLGQFCHIKDLERALFSKAQELGITIEKKQFIRLHQDSTVPGVVVANIDGVETFVAADHVFDCTGSQRVVVHAVNRICPDSPMQLKTVSDVLLPDHFLAYVRISEEYRSQLKMPREYLTILRERLDALAYAQSMLKLMSFGWREFVLPRCYAYPFGKGKTCLYLHAPPHLLKEQYDSWVQTVLECYLSPISYEHLPVSKKYASKPRFVPFKVTAKSLRDVSYKGKNLPLVVALGDAQIDSEYALGHGIYNGISRIDALLIAMTIEKGDIQRFNSLLYLQEIRGLLYVHKEGIIKEATKQRQVLLKAEERAPLQFRQAWMASTDDLEKSAMNTVLNKIDPRLGRYAHERYQRAFRSFIVIHDTQYLIKLTFLRASALVSMLQTIHADLLVALIELPVICETERHHVETLLGYLATSWKTMGHHLVRHDQLFSAVEAYKNARSIYTLESFKGRHPSEELSIYSNLAIAHYRERRYLDAIAVVNTALSIHQSYPPDLELVARHDKLVRTLIRALCAEACDLVMLNNRAGALSFHTEAKEIMLKHEGLLSLETIRCVRSLIYEVQKSLDQMLRSERLSSLEAIDNSSSEALRSATCSKDPEMLLNAQQDCTETDRSPPVSG